MTTRPPPSSKCKPKASSKASLVPLPGGVAIFKRLCGMDSLAVLLASARSYDRCWTPPITLMAMILGHLIGGGTLETVLALARTGLLDSLCSSTKMLSTLLESTDSTSGYSQARARLGITWLRHCLGAQAKELQNLAGGWQWHGMAVRVLDGTMITMRPHGRIPERYPPHSNQHGTCYWCQTRVLACMCLGTGVILNLVTGNAMDSEQAQTVRLLLFGDLGGPSTLPATVLWMGDANFGVWRVVAAASQTHQHSLMRLTLRRAGKLAGTTPLVPGLDLAVTWSPSRYDQIDTGLVKAPVTGRLVVIRLERRGYRPVDLLLFTTVAASIKLPELAALYLKRWNIELSLRHFKTQMGLGELSAKSPAMAKRELLTGVHAYNLVRGVMLLAASVHLESPAELSFAKARAELTYVLIASALALRGGTASWDTMLHRIATGKLKQRRTPRPSEPRLKRHRGETFPPLKGTRANARSTILPPDEPALAKS